MRILYCGLSKSRGSPDELEAAAEGERGAEEASWVVGAAGDPEWCIRFFLFSCENWISSFVQGSRDLCQRRLPMCQLVQLYTFVAMLHLRSQLLSSVQ